MNTANVDEWFNSPCSTRKRGNREIKERLPVIWKHYKWRIRNYLTWRRAYTGRTKIVCWITRVRIKRTLMRIRKHAYLWPSLRDKSSLSSLIIMPGRVHPVDGIMFTIQVRFLLQVGVAGDEQTCLRIVVTRSHMHQIRIAIVAVTARRCEQVGIGTAPRRPHTLTETLIRDRPDHRLTGVGDASRAAQSILDTPCSPLPDAR